MKRILVPLDGSQLAERAIPIATRIARASLGSILFLRVVTTASEFGVYMSEPSALVQESMEEDLVEATDYLAQVRKRPDLAGIEIDVGIFTGGAALQILDAARTRHIELIVMCSHGETGIKRWIMGSVAQKVVRHCTVPVLVLRDGGTESARLHKNDQGLRTLVTLDGSDMAETVLEPAVHLTAKLSAPSRGELHLLRVVDLPHHYSSWRSGGRSDAEMQGQAMQQAEAYLRSTADRLQAKLPADLPLTITTSAILESDIAGTIIKRAEHGEDGLHAYNLVAMATHGRSGVPRWAMGSVTERVLDGTKLPMLIVRPVAVHH